VNSPALVAAHRAATRGVARTRFPPEPNGYLHIGHAKSMNLNFEGAFREVGLIAPDAEAGSAVPAGAAGGEFSGYETIFRYDDTNPDAESQEYIDNQAENVRWMGWRPARVTHSSDYFEQLHGFAVELIRRGRAYVCHQTKAEIEASREAAAALHRPAAPGAPPAPAPPAPGAPGAPESPFRDRPAAESLREFALMRAGAYAEGSTSLRLKIDMRSVNPTLWDPVAYRIKYTPHPMTGAAWCIYPSYDFSHALIDSLEHVDFSLCTLEFEVRRELYYWVLRELDVWRPRVWEFARLEITHVQLSKRKILKLVQDGTVRGWDDPRIPTLNGLRRRGYTPQAINAFCRDIGVTRHYNTVQYGKLEHHVRAHLDQVARRDFLVLRPLCVELVGAGVGADEAAAAAFFRLIEAPDFPRDAASPAAPRHALPLTRRLYVEREDFRDEDDPSFFGLAPGKVVGLRYAGLVRVVGVERDAATGEPLLLRCEYDHERRGFADGAGAGAGAAAKVKGNLHWVSGAAPGEEPPRVEVRLYEHLFVTERPGETGDWEREINPHSERVVRDARANPALVARLHAQAAAADAGGAGGVAGGAGAAAPVAGTPLQLERVGYFVVDKDSRLGAAAAGGPPHLVLNQTVGLKENNETKKVKAGKA